jgi:hypothetical protein
MSYLNTSMVKRAVTGVEAAILANLVGTGVGAVAGARQTTGTGGEKAKGALAGGILAGAGAGAGSLAVMPIAAKIGHMKAALPLITAGALTGGYGGYKLKDLID